MWTVFCHIIATHIICLQHSFSCACVQVGCHNQCDTERLRCHGLVDLPVIPSEPVGAPHVRQLHAGQ